MSRNAEAACIAEVNEREDQMATARMERAAVAAMPTYSDLMASHARLLEAAACAKNVLFLLTPEVSALGMRAYLVHGRLDAALSQARELTSMRPKSGDLESMRTKDLA